ncbi:MAG TPA: NUDIX hydrolase [bacterium]|nr:NUDIX hydrolase [bacterium]HNT65587.1 NUDIX hydrolase [bacterium]
MVHTPMSAVRAIIVNDKNELLFLRRANTAYMSGYWCLPGGKVDYNRTLAEAVKNEIKEETALICTHQAFLFYWETLPGPQWDTHCISFVFHCQTKGQVRLNEESDAYIWAGENQIDRLPWAFETDKIAVKYWRHFQQQKIRK